MRFFSPGWTPQLYSPVTNTNPSAPRILPAKLFKGLRAPRPSDTPCTSGRASAGRSPWRRSTRRLRPGAAAARPRIERAGFPSGRSDKSRKRQGSGCSMAISRRWISDAPSPRAPRLSRRALCGSCLPACSATMYSAYQSGQFSSCSPPVRFSCSPWAAAARRSAAARSAGEANVVSPRPRARAAAT